MSNLPLELKKLIIDALGLEDISVDDIGNDEPLFGEGLGLDSVALRLMQNQKMYVNILLALKSLQLLLLAIKKHKTKHH